MVGARCCGRCLEHAVGLSGCLVFVKAPSYPPPIRLRAEQPFTLYVANEITGALEAHCRVE